VKGVDGVIAGVALLLPGRKIRCRVARKTAQGSATTLARARERAAKSVNACRDRVVANLTPYLAPAPSLHHPPLARVREGSENR
jgi:hypothetical protein